MAAARTRKKKTLKIKNIWRSVPNPTPNAAPNPIPDLLDAILEERGNAYGAWHEVGARFSAMLNGFYMHQGTVCFDASDYPIIMQIMKLARLGHARGDVGREKMRDVVRDNRGYAKGLEEILFP